MRLLEIACFTSKPKRTIEFYQRLFNMKSPSGSYETAAFMLEGVKFFIHESSPSTTSKKRRGRLSREALRSGADLPFGDHIAFEVENLDQVCRQLTRRGMSIDFPPREYYWGRSAYLKDPDGRWLELHEAGR